MNCKNCNTEIQSNFCPNCGQPKQLKRIDGHYIVHEIEHVLHFERGILYTIRELVTRPGHNIRNYLSDNRSRLVKPIIFIIVCSLIYSLCNHFFHFEDAYIHYAGERQSTTSAIFKWVQGHYGYANIIMGLFIAFWIKLFFMKSTYNFFEVLILLCFVMGMGMLLYAVFGIVQGLTHVHTMQVGGVVGFVYITWALGQFFGKEKTISYVKAFCAYILGMASFTLLVILLGALIDHVWVH